MWSLYTFHSGFWHLEKKISWSVLVLLSYSYTAHFAISDNSWGVQRYRAAVIGLQNGSYVYIVPVHSLYLPLLLPATHVGKLTSYKHK